MRDTAATAGLGWLEAPLAFSLLLLVILLPAAVSACGQEGGYRSLSSPPLQPTVEPPRGVVGESVQWVLPLYGGCGGPYTMEVVDGTLPPGVTVDQGQHMLHGKFEWPGTFGFRLRVGDTGCVPPSLFTPYVRWRVEP